MTTIQHKRGTAANWTSSNPVLEAAEIGYETDTGKFKIGDGTSTWSALSYFEIASGTDANYYPSAIVFNAGSSSGPTLDLTMSGTGAPDLTPVAIPSASASASGVVTTGTQTFAGNKTFTGGVGIQVAGNSGLSIGRTDGTASVNYIDFNNGATAIDYDARIYSSGGTGTSGQGDLSFYAATSTFNGDVILAGTSASTDIRTLEITSQGFARIDMTGDSANGAGEPGGAAITFGADSTSNTYGIVGATNAAGGSGVSGISFTDSTENSLIVGTNGARSLHLGTNNATRLTIDSAGDATFTGEITSTYTGTWSNPNIILQGTEPSIRFQETGQPDAHIGTNSGNFYILGDTDSSGTYDTIPFYVNLTSGNATFLGSVTASSFSGNASSATTATNATNINISTTDGNTSDTAMYPVFVAANTTGNQLPHTDVSGFTYNASTNAINTGIGSFSGDVAVNGGDLTTTASTFNLVNTNATTLNIGGAATTISMGATNASVSVPGTIRSTYSSGSEGGELFLATPASSTTIDTGVAIDLYQNKFRIFESGGTGTRGYYLDITDGTSGAGINLRPPIYQKIIDATTAATSLGTVSAGASTTYSAFGTNGVALKASTAYEVECLLLLTSVATGTSGTPATLVITPGSASGAAVPTENQLYYNYSSSTTVLTNAAALSGVHRTGTTTFASLNTITIGTGTTNYLRAFIKGIVRINTAGNLTFRLAYTGATTGSISAINVGAGSYLKFTELGSNTVTNIGTWA